MGDHIEPIISIPIPVVLANEQESGGSKHPDKLSLTRLAVFEIHGVDKVPHAAHAHGQNRPKDSNCAIKGFQPRLGF